MKRIDKHIRDNDINALNVLNALNDINDINDINSMLRTSLISYFHTGLIVKRKM